MISLLYVIDVELFRLDLETFPVAEMTLTFKSHSRSYDLLLVFHSQYVSILHRFSDIHSHTLIRHLS